MRDPKIVRVSELISFNRCPRKTWLQYEEGWSESGIEAGIGTAMHTMLADYYGGVVDPEQWEETVENLEPEGRATAQAMFDSYDAEVQRRDLDHGEVLDVELRIQREIGPVLLSGQIDLVYRGDDGLVTIRDHKTVGQFHETAQRDFQLMTYLWLASPLYPREDTFVVEHNLIKRNKRTKQAKPPFIQRNRHIVSREEVDAWGTALRIMAIKYYDAMQSARRWAGVKSPWLPPLGRNDCAWSCQFSDICGLFDDREADTDSVLVTEFTQSLPTPSEPTVVISKSGDIATDNRGGTQ